MKNKQARKPYRVSHTFMRLLSVLLCITLLLCLSLTMFFYSSMANSIAEKELNLHKILLRNQINATDDMLNVTQQSMLHLTMSESLIQVCFLEEYSNSICTKVLLALSSLSAHNDIINSLILYVPKLNMIFDDQFSSVSLSESREQDLVTGYINGVPRSNTVVYGTQTSTLFYQDGSVIIARNYPLSNISSASSSLLFCVLNTNTLFKQLQNTGIRVYDAFGDPLYNADSDTLEHDSSVMEQLVKDVSDTVNYLHGEDTTLIFAKSSVTGWRFVYEVDTASIWQPMGQAMISTLPLVMVMFSIIALVCCFVVKQTIRPLEKALLSVEMSSLAPESSKQQHKDEFAYLRAVTAEMANTKNELHRLIESISGDVTRRLFTELFSGTQYDYSVVSQLMESVHSKFHPDDFYVVGLLSGEENGGTRPLSQMRNAQGQLQEIVKSFEQEHPEFHGQLIRLRDKESCVVLSFDSVTSLLSIRQLLSQLNQQFADFFRQHHVPCRFTCGHIYHSVLDLLYSYQDAANMLAPVAVSEETTTEQPASVEEITRAPNVANHVAQILSYIQNDELANAKTLANRVLQSITEAGTPNVYSLFFNDLVDGLLKLDSLDLVCLTNNPFIAMQSENHQQNPETLSAQAADYLVLIFDQLYERQKRMNVPCIVTAREYIRKNYTDGNLSLEMVAEAANVTGSYLSRIFRTNLGITFTDYLGKFRVEQGRKLLETTSESVKDIAAKVGFNSVQQFIRVFKKHVGQSPGEYRDNHRS